MRKLKLVLGGLLVALASMTANASTINLNYTNGNAITFTTLGEPVSLVNGLYETVFDVDVANDLTTTNWSIAYVDDPSLGGPLTVELFDQFGASVYGLQQAGLGDSPLQFTWSNLLAGDYTLKLTTNNAFANGTVSAVPVPAAALLFGTALLGFAGFSTRRKV